MPKEVNIGLRSLVLIMTPALSLVTTAIKLHTGANLTCVLKECVGIKELTRPQNKGNIIVFLINLVEVTGSIKTRKIRIYFTHSNK